MGRKKGFDSNKIIRIVGFLANNPDGIWLRRIAAETRMSPATVAHYLDTVLKPLIDDISLGTGGKPLLRVVKLKQLVLEKIHEGKSMGEIMKILKLIEKIGK